MSRGTMESQRRELIFSVLLERKLLHGLTDEEAISFAVIQAAREDAQDELRRSIYNGEWWRAKCALDAAQRRNKIRKRRQ